MLDKSKLLEFFNAGDLTVPIHVVGCGAVGSHICEQLARIGCEEVHIWDFDTVEPKNITNQMFFNDDIGAQKVNSMLILMKRINPEIKIQVHHEGLQHPYILDGYIFMCADSIDLRKQIITANQYNPNVVAFADFRIRLTDAQYYFALRTDMAQVTALLKSMAFTQEEALAATPQSACGTTLSVVYTVKIITSIGISNFIRWALNKPTKTMVLVDMEQLTLDAFPMQ